MERERAQRFILQSVFTMFAEDYQLLPKDIFTKILLDSHQARGNPYDLIGGLFRQMNSKEPARGGRFKEVPYFNGGLFAAPEPIELTDVEVKMLLNASSKLWNKVNPAIFGTIFQSSMGEKARHAFGAHFTTELDILKIVHPTIIQPWREKIAKAKGCKKIAFSGGVFQNGLLVDLTIEHLSKNYDLFFHKELSPNDENISFGQLIYHEITNKRGEND